MKVNQRATNKETTIAKKNGNDIEKNIYKEICKDIGKSADLLSSLKAYIETHYDHEPVMKREGKDQTLAIRYRRGGKTLVTIYPQKGGFTVLVVLGKDEVKRAKEVKLGRNVGNTYKNAKQYHDGRWLWIKPTSREDVESVKSLLAVKRKPKA